MELRSSDVSNALHKILKPKDIVEIQDNEIIVDIDYIVLATLKVLEAFNMLTLEQYTISEDEDEE